MMRIHKNRTLSLAICFISALSLMACSDSEPDRGDLDWPSGYVAPLNGATFSLGSKHLPNAERRYRSGTHKGFDFFDGLSSVSAHAGTPVVAVADGELIRIDQAYAPLPDAALQRYTELAPGKDFVADFAMDQLRGRQVWLLHDGGYVSRYAHLETVSDELAPGDRVSQGELLGEVGASGIPSTEESAAPVAHLHYELWHPDGSYLGKNLSPLEIHRLVGEVFGPSALPRYSREVLAQVDEGEAPPDVFPPDSVPEIQLRTTPPNELIAGDAFAVSVTWNEYDAIRVEDLVVALGQETTGGEFLGNRPLGVVDAGNGAWVIGSAAAPGKAYLTIATVDQYGQTLSGGREIQVNPRPNMPAPLQWPMGLMDLYTPERQEQEQAVLMQAAEAAYDQRDPYWQAPFQAPVNGRVIRLFGQEVFEDPVSSGLPLPGVYLLPDEEGATVSVSNRGQVFFAGEMPLRGKTVIVNHGGGVVSVYAHLDEIHVESGQVVDRGQGIGVSGTSGAMDQEVLRWEIHVTGVASDPLGWLDQLLPEQY